MLNHNADISASELLSVMHTADAPVVVDVRRLVAVALRVGCVRERTKGALPPLPPSALTCAHKSWFALVLRCAFAVWVFVAVSFGSHKF